MRHFVWTAALLAAQVAPLAAAEKDTPAAAATRKKLQTKISVEFKETRIEEAMKDIIEKVKDASDKDLSIQLDNPGGVSNNIPVTYTGQDQTVAQILDGMFKKNDLGYVVVSKEYKTFKGGRYDGWLLIVKGKERGYPAGQEPTANKDSTKPKADATADDKTEQEAARKLKEAKGLAADGQNSKAKQRYKEVISKYPKTKAAEEAKDLLKKLEDK